MRRPIQRRTTLKGLGGIAIGLPLLEEMTATAAMTAAARNVSKEHK